MRVTGVHPETQTVDLVQIVPEYTNAPIGDLIVTNDYGMDIIATTMAPDVLQGIPIVQLRWGKFSIQAMPQIGDTGYIEYLQMIFKPGLEREKVRCLGLINIS